MTGYPQLSEDILQFGGWRKDRWAISLIRAVENSQARTHQDYPVVPDDQLDQVKQGCVYALINSFPCSQRWAFILHSLNDLSINTVAAILEKAPMRLGFWYTEKIDSVSPFVVDFDSVQTTIRYHANEESLYAVSLPDLFRSQSGIQPQRRG